MFSSDQLMLGIGIGCACGATATLILVFIVSFFKSKCRSPKIASPRVKTVEPMNGGPHMRTPSVNGSVDSSDSISHSRNGFIRRPLTTSRRSSMIDGKSNGFLPWCITGPRLWKRKYRSVEHCNWNEKVVTYSVMSRLVAKQVVPATKGMLEIQTPDNLQDHLIRLRGIAVKDSTGLMQYAINC